MPLGDSEDNAKAFLEQIDSIKPTDVSSVRIDAFTSEDDFNGLAVEKGRFPSPILPILVRNEAKSVLWQSVRLAHYIWPYTFESMGRGLFTPSIPSILCVGIAKGLGGVDSSH